MRRSSVAAWCVFLLVASTNAAALTNSTSVDDERIVSTIRYEPHANTNATKSHDEADTARYHLSENSTSRNDNDHEVQYEFRSNTTKNDRTNDDEETRYEFRAHSTKNHEEGTSESYELRANSTLTDDESNSTESAHPSNELPTTDENGDVISYEICDSGVCIPLCCALGERLVNEKCVLDNNSHLFPNVHDNATSSLERNKTLKEAFQLIVRDPCQTRGRYMLNPVDYPDDEYVFLTNGSLYQPIHDGFIHPMSYCLAVVHSNKYEVTICFGSSGNEAPVVDGNQSGKPIGLLVSLPFLLLTFLVYSVLPELWNMHGYTLRGYVGALFIAYTTLASLQLSPQQAISDPLCIAMAFVIHFSFLASFFWLNVMCFDIWWTFGGFRSLQGSVKQRERKKFIMYSIYAWGSASVLTIVCAIMDFVPSVPKELIRPEFGVERCWFSTDAARALYFYGPMGVTVICNICLFISTAFKIVRHRRDTAHHLSSSESRRHDDNKQWFNLYLKLFIVMGINWSMEIVSWLFKSAPDYIWYLTDITNTLQGLIIFITFVWKKKIKRLLLKRFGCQERGLFSRNSTRSGCHSSASRTCTTTSVMPLQEKISPYVHANCRPKNSSDEAECP